MEPTPQLREALLRIQIEYVELPQLKLSARQVQRLWSLPTGVCETVLTTLLRKGFLTLSSDGAYVRRGVKRSDIDRPVALPQAS